VKENLSSRYSRKLKTMTFKQFDYIQPRSQADRDAWFRAGIGIPAILSEIQAEFLSDGESITLRGSAGTILVSPRDVSIVGIDRLPSSAIVWNKTAIPIAGSRSVDEIRDRLKERVPETRPSDPYPGNYPMPDPRQPTVIGSPMKLVFLTRKKKKRKGLMSSPLFKAVK
jgi:hypothetical protein